MTVLAYDEVWVREPRLMVPRMVPVGPVKIDKAHPIGAGTRLYVLPGVNMDIDLSGFHKGNSTLLPIKSVGLRGNAVRFDGTTAQKITFVPIDAYRAPTSTTNYMWWCHGHIVAGGYYPTAFQISRASGTYNWVGGVAATTSLYYTFGGASSSTGTNNGEFVFVGIQSAGERRVFVNGVNTSTFAGGANIGSTDTWCVGSSNTTAASASFQFLGNIYSFGVAFGNFMPFGTEFSLNPYQFLIPA